MPQSFFEDIGYAEVDVQLQEPTELYSGHCAVFYFFESLEQWMLVSPVEVLMEFRGSRYLLASEFIKNCLAI